MRLKTEEVADKVAVRIRKVGKGQPTITIELFDTNPKEVADIIRGALVGACAEAAPAEAAPAKNGGKK